MQVYVITNTVNGKHYVGQTRLTLTARWRAHRNAAKAGRFCRLLAAAIRKYGASVFEIRAVAQCHTQEEMDRAEADAIESFVSLSPHGYNLRSGGNSGAMHSDTKALISQAHKGRAKPPEWRDAIRQANTGKVYSADRVEAMRKARWAKPYRHSTETREKIAASMRGKPQYPNQKEALRKAHLGAKRTPEQCARIRAGILAANARKRESAWTL